MVNSRRIEDLIIPAQSRFRAFLAACAVDPWLVGNGITILVTSTLRDNESQDALYAQGRTKPGKVVTNAKGGQSWHNWGCAGDVVPLHFGKPVWGTRTGFEQEVWQTVGKLGKKAGLEWAGDWRTFREFPHFQFTNGLTLAELQSGRVIA